MRLASTVNSHVIQTAVDAVFLRVICSENGRVRVGISREPLAGLRKVAGREAVAAQWAWIGSAAKAKAVERALRKRWASRYRAGEGFGFDYGGEGRLFRDELEAIFMEVVGAAPDWRKVGPEEMVEIMGALRKERRRPSLPLKRR
ncbi:hypothetical protein [Stenotrophomonas maltophilia]|uniref:hypothetical protein n=1 Tax=Stenotrophomonas maltophilia TaxID=40324 RepID=UPI000ABEE13D|nr:hypothetical protein [Stenotrophomonas maltophilia]